MQIAHNFNTCHKPKLLAFAGSYELYERCWMVCGNVHWWECRMSNVWRMYFTRHNNNWNKLHIRHHQIVCTSLSKKRSHWISYFSYWFVRERHPTNNTHTHNDWIGKKKLNLDELSFNRTHVPIATYVYSLHICIRPLTTQFWVMLVY